MVCNSWDMTPAWDINITKINLILQVSTTQHTGWSRYSWWSFYNSDIFTIKQHSDETSELQWLISADGGSQLRWWGWVDTNKCPMFWVSAPETRTPWPEEAQHHCSQSSWSQYGPQQMTSCWNIFHTIPAGGRRVALEFSLNIDQVIGWKQSR